MFQNFHFCGGYENGILRRRFSLAGGGKGKEGKTADLQNGKVQNDDAEGGRVACRRGTTATRALRARFARPEYMQIYSAAREARRLQLRGAEGAEPVFCLHGGK